MEAFQERVVAEKLELDEKRTKLGEFLAGKFVKTLPEEEQKRLDRQAELMGEYSLILGARIENFTKG